MKRFKHTPSPWINVGGWVDAENNGIICSLSASMKSEDVDEANANLIAAAPELLESLIEISEMQKLNYGDGMTTHIKLIEMVRKADLSIAKALGEAK